MTAEFFWPFSFVVFFLSFPFSLSLFLPFFFSFLVEGRNEVIKSFLGETFKSPLFASATAKKMLFSFAAISATINLWRRNSRAPLNVLRSAKRLKETLSGGREAKEGNGIEIRANDPYSVRSRFNCAAFDRFAREIKQPARLVSTTRRSNLRFTTVGQSVLLREWNERARSECRCYSKDSPAKQAERIQIDACFYWIQECRCTVAQRCTWFM